MTSEQLRTLLESGLRQNVMTEAQKERHYRNALYQTGVHIRKDIPYQVTDTVNQKAAK